MGYQQLYGQWNLYTSQALARDVGDWPHSSFHISSRYHGLLLFRRLERFVVDVFCGK